MTFRGTRVFVADVLDMVAEGMSWDAISREWRGTVTREAIAEAIRLARDALLAQKDRFAPDAPTEAATDAAGG